MGLFSGIEAQGRFFEFRNYVQGVYVDTILPQRHTEPFQAYLALWTFVLIEHGQRTLAHTGEHVVKYYGMINPAEAVNLLASHLATILVPKFDKTRAFREHENSVKGLLAAQGLDGGARFNALFREINPKTYDWFVSAYGVPPFSPSKNSERISRSIG
jgi:hypothetical protein